LKHVLNYFQTSKWLIHRTGPESKESQDRQVIRQDTAVPPAGNLCLTHSLDIGKECSHPCISATQSHEKQPNMYTITVLLFSFTHAN